MALVVASIVVVAFARPIDAILNRLLRDEISQAWSRYLRFAIYVVGIGGGVPVFSFEKYLSPTGPDKVVAELTSDRWVLEIYRTIMGTLQSAAWMLLLFFLLTLIALAVVRALEARRPRPEAGERVQ